MRIRKGAKTGGRRVAASISDVLYVGNDKRDHLLGYGLDIHSLVQRRRRAARLSTCSSSFTKRSVAFLSRRRRGNNGHLRRRARLRSHRIARLPSIADIRIAEIGLRAKGRSLRALSSAEASMLRRSISQTRDSSIRIVRIGFVAENRTTAVSSLGRKVRFMPHF